MAAGLVQKVSRGALCSCPSFEDHSNRKCHVLSMCKCKCMHGHTHTEVLEVCLFIVMAVSAAELKTFL